MNWAIFYYGVRIFILFLFLHMESICTDGWFLLPIIYVASNSVAVNMTRGMAGKQHLSWHLHAYWNSQMLSRHFHALAKNDTCIPLVRIPYQWLFDYDKSYYSIIILLSKSAGNEGVLNRSCHSILSMMQRRCIALYFRLSFNVRVTNKNHHWWSAHQTLELASWRKVQV